MQTERQLEIDTVPCILINKRLYCLGDAIANQDSKLLITNSPLHTHIPRT